MVFLICQGIRQTDRILFLCIIAEDLNLNNSLKDISKVAVPYLHLRVPCETWVRKRLLTGVHSCSVYSILLIIHSCALQLNSITELCVKSCTPSRFVENGRGVLENLIVRILKLWWKSEQWSSVIVIDRARKTWQNEKTFLYRLGWTNDFFRFSF